MRSRRPYPRDVLDDFAPLAPRVREGDLEAIAAPLDFLGINYYTRNVVGADAWAFGYSRRFGLVHVDFETLERVPKASTTGTAN